MNARDIIKLAAQLYVYDALKKKITILTNIQKGKDINVDIFLPKVTDVTVSDFAKHLQKAIESQPEEERAKHRKFFGEPISFCRCVARGNLMASVLVEEFNCVERGKDSLKKYKKCNSILFLPTSKALDSLNPKDAIEASAINFFNESCQALGILVDLKKKRLAT